ncbi:MAG: RHS repeat-associated core domain-containing protein, partial [Hydrogenophaga sp.]|nr:RHS repeat-associated core domain-containing protein [Hydrogenophaga sp.]
MQTKKFLYHNTVRSAPFLTTLCASQQATWRRKGRHGVYTGQEEDKESGLLYYKARYYDPGLGRFLQADDILFPAKSQGMNRMMYVSGNPIFNIDPTGHFQQNSKTQSLVKSLLIAKLTINFLKGETDIGISELQEKFQVYVLLKYGGSIVKEIGKAFRHIARTIDHTIKSASKGIGGTLRAVGRSSDHTFKGIHRGITGSARQIGRAMDGGVHWLTSRGSYSRNKGNTLDHSLGTNFFRGIERSDAGRLVTDAWLGLFNANCTNIWWGLGLLYFSIPLLIVGAFGIFFGIGLL